jgi:tRNA-2-methylthio-N6-dimethylallyladenosine synthase
MNISDGERVQKTLDKMGFDVTDKEEEADLLGVIACSVRQKGIDKVYSRISKWNKWKRKKNLITFVSGCVLPADKEKFLKSFDLVFNMSDLPDLPTMISQYGIVSQAGMQNLDPGFKDLLTDSKAGINPAGFKLSEISVNTKEKASELVKNEKIEDFWNITPKYGSGFEAFIPIQNGCDKYCTYCAVPYTRGREVSRPSSEIMSELKRLVENNYKSITLLGQNVNSYGLDKKGGEINFAQLLQKIGEYGDNSDKDFWVYFTSPHPRDMSDKVLEVIAEHKCLAKQIHLPVQSGDDSVLKNMNRKHNLATYRNIIESIRRILPTATIFTDIIVGFTEETDEQFANTKKIMSEFKYNMAYIAQYSPRPGAVSSKWEDTVSKDVKKKRFHELTEELMKYSLEHNQKMIGRTYKVLVRGRDRNRDYLSALTEGKIIVRFKSDDDSLLGQYVEVKVNSAIAFSTEGELV